MAPVSAAFRLTAPGSSLEDLDEITSREEAKAASVPTALLNEYRGIWGLFGRWLEDRAICSTPIYPGTKNRT